MSLRLDLIGAGIPAMAANVIADAVQGTDDGVSQAELNILDGATLSTAELNILDGVTATFAELNYLDIATLGTGAASKAVVLDAGEDYTWPATGVLTYGVLNDGTTTLAATALEINRNCDMSARLVALAATSLAVTVAAHEGRTISLNHTGAASTATLPAATGSGAVFRFVVGAVNTSNHVVDLTSTDLMKGVVYQVDDDANAATAYSAKSTDNTLTLNGTTTGGQIGDWAEFVDIASGVYSVKGGLTVPAGSNVADPFSAT
jgi:hypothetical protein